jgi:AsmA protein
MKKILIGIAAVFLILLIVAFAVPYVISADTIKGPLILKIQALTGRKLRVDGALRVKFFPLAGITMEHVTLSNPAGFDDAAPFITLKSLDVGVAVMALLHNDIQIRQMVMDEPHINLHVNKNEVPNWQFGAAEAAAKTPAHPAKSFTMPVLPQNLRLSDVELKNGTINFIDDARGESWQLDKLNATVALKGLDSPLTVTGSGEWNAKTVHVKATIDSLRKLSQLQPVALGASVNSDLIALDLQGSLMINEYQGKIKLTSPSLKAVNAWLDPEAPALPTPAPLTLAVSGDADCSMRSCTLEKVQFSLDKLQATGRIKTTFNGAKPSVLFDVSSPMLDFNPFLPPLGKDDASMGIVSNAFAGEGDMWSEKPINLAGLQAINIKAFVQTGGILFPNIVIGKTTMDAGLTNGRFTFNVKDADMYNGKGSIDFILDAQVQLLALETTLDFKGIDAAKLLKDALDVTRVSGTGDFHMHATSHGTNEKSIVSNLAGNGNFKLANGAVKGINLANIGQSAFVKFSDNTAQKTDISVMTGSFAITNGTLSNHDLTMEAAPLHLTGQGDIDLINRMIDYKLTPQIISKAQGATKEGLSVPILIKGSLDHPLYQPDVAAVVQDAIQDPKKLREQLKNSRETIKEQLKSPDGLKNLKGLLKGF